MPIISADAANSCAAAAPGRAGAPPRLMPRTGALAVASAVTGLPQAARAKQMKAAPNGGLKIRDMKTLRVLAAARAAHLRAD